MREVNTIFPKEFGMAGARGAPIVEHDVWVPPRPIGKQSIVGYRDRIRHPGWDRQVYYQDLADLPKRLHHLVELLGGEGAVIAYVYDNAVSELAGSTTSVKNIDDRRGLATSLHIDQRRLGMSCKSEATAPSITESPIAVTQPSGAAVSGVVFS